MNPVSSITPQDFESSYDKNGYFIIKCPVMNPAIIPGTDLVMQVPDIKDYIESLPASKEKKILVYCNIWASSHFTILQLKSLGYENIFNLKGGISAWQEYRNTLRARQV